jgi:RNA polymerase sigma-70 factor (ECF subfamily)
MPGVLMVLSEDDIDWKAVYNDTLPKLFHYFCLRIGDECLAEDLTATTFERAWKSRNRYKNSRGPVIGWLFGIARYVLADHFRADRNEFDLEAAVHVPAGEIPEVKIIQNNDFARLSGLLAQISKRERDLVALRYGAGMTNRDIAKQVGLSETNVGTILHRVIKKLRKQWEVFQ